jgi:Bifunctional DNA primase/polymerase, N-terminal
MAPLDESLQLSVANICLEKGWFVFPLLTRRKEPDPEFSPNGFKSASNDPAQIHEWWTKKPSANIGIDLGRSNLTVLDFDKGEPPAELNLPETLRVKTSRGTHVYLRGISEQKKMFFQGQHIGEIKSEGGYVLGPASAHPDGTIYEVVLKAPVSPIPEGLVEKLTTAPKEVHDDAPRDAAGKVPHGSIHPWALTQAGKLRNLGLDLDMLEPALLKLVHEQCAAPIDENKIRTLARSVCGSWPAGQSTDIVLTQSALAIAQLAQVAESVELPQFEDVGYPRFPEYVMSGTSIFEGFVKPVCDLNSRISYFMWLSAEILLLNYIGPKIRIKTGMGPRPFRGSIYSVLIGRKGKTNKSSSVDDAMNYFNYAGCLTHAGRDVKNADGKILTWTAGSPEGLGIEMQKTGCKNAVLCYDELSQLVSKAGIDTSALTSSLLTMYEAKKFANSVKSGKESYSLDPESYCVSLIACTTDKKFAELWSKLAGTDTGLDDRFFFVLQPDPLPEPRLQTYVNTVMGSIETKKRIDKAVIRGDIEFEDSQNAHLKALVAIENRYANRAEKWAVALAIDLGLDAVDDDCWERAVDIVKYEIAVKKYLKSYEATTREGQIQQDIRRFLEMSKGKMQKRDLLRKINYDRFGTSLWSASYGGLLKHGIIREEGSGVRGEPVFVQLLVKRDTGDDE